MMPKFSKTSLSRLETCHEDLQALFHEVIKVFDCSILCGFRGMEQQMRVYEQGLSQVRWPNSKHNHKPSWAVDVIPYPVDWKDLNRFRYFGGYVLGVADILELQDLISHKVRWGGDWDRDTKLRNNKFNDFAHFELV
jgi:peptidoglycan L-alanyl-D-glutamate endopeptidase CwlK